jgi:hypothetical protein
MTCRNRRNTVEGSTNKILAANREQDEHSEKTDEGDEILQRWWLHWQQINEEENDEEGDGDKNEKSKLTRS